MPKPKVGTGSSGIFQCSTHRLGKITPFSSRFTVYLIFNWQYYYMFDTLWRCVLLSICTEVRTLIIEHDSCPVSLPFDITIFFAEGERERKRDCFWVYLY